MNTFRRRAVLLVVGLCVLVAVAGCRTTEPVVSHTEAAPGPWKDLKVSIVFEPTDYAVNVTVSVAGHPKGRGYVQKFELFNGEESIGNRTIESSDAPSVTFILDNPAWKRITVEVTSTELGRWVSNPREVPKKK